MSTPDRTADIHADIHAKAPPAAAAAAPDAGCAGSGEPHATAAWPDRAALPIAPARHGTRSLLASVALVSVAHLAAFTWASAEFGPEARAQGMPAEPLRFATRLLDGAPEQADAHAPSPASPAPEPDTASPPKAIPAVAAATPPATTQPPPQVAPTVPTPTAAVSPQAQAMEHAVEHTPTPPAPDDAPPRSFTREPDTDIPMADAAPAPADEQGHAAPSGHTLLAQASPGAVSPPVSAAAPSPSPNPRNSAAPAGEADAAPPPPLGRATLGPVRVPASQRLTYDVSGEARRFPYRANAELLWKADAGRYQSRLEISALLFPSRIQTSSGLLTAQGLAPVRFSDKLRTEVAAHIERDKGRVTYSANTPDTPVVPGLQDRLSVLIQLGSLLAGDPARYPAGSRITVPTVGPRDADTWVFAVGPTETLDTPHGRHTARRLNRVPQREHDLRVDLWVSPELQHLPLQLRMTQSNGDFVLMQLKAAAAP